MHTCQIRDGNDSIRCQLPGPFSNAPDDNCSFENSVTCHRFKICIYRCSQKDQFRVIDSFKALVLDTLWNINRLGAWECIKSGRISIIGLHVWGKSCLPGR